ncbi:MAG: NADH:flavin oxidoreductase/NADH oxidase [Deltaproteobacteria bacterium]|nr:NADH:flavin oxidoreductase/NADH oxidase [Deltaproteobacteria bacterium]
MASLLFSPLCLRELEFKNRIFVSPMCQYSCIDGMPTDWHLVHLGSRAVGGAGLVMAEATAVVPEGRISPCDTGIWTDGHAAAFQRIAAFLSAQGSVPGLQLAHAGRKASTDMPWRGGNPLTPSDGGWQPLAPSPIPFAANYTVPMELSPEEIGNLVKSFTEAAKRALIAGFKVIEIHMAHGYLLHSFLSPLSNHRADEFGADFEGRTRFPLQVAKAVRDVWPASLPVFVRISATDWVEGGWDLGQSVWLCRKLREIGIDMIDCSSGGLVADAKIPVAPGFQVSFAAAIRQEVKMPTAAVGLITNAQQAEQTLVCGDADAVFLARQMLRDPYWPLHAAQSLGEDIPWPDPYVRAKQ